MKKKVIKPFSLDNMMNHKIETKCGYPVTILFTDVVLIIGEDESKDEISYPIFAQIKTPNGKNKYSTYTKKGQFDVSGRESKFDLVLVEEQEVPSVTKEEFDAHIEWFINHEHDTIEGFDKTVGEQLEKVVSPEYAQNAKEDVKYCTLKLEGLENRSADRVTIAYVKDAVGSANKALGYSAKERNAFSWQKVWFNRGCFGIINEKNAKKIVENCPEFPFRLYYKSNITSDDHGEA